MMAMTMTKWMMMMWLNSKQPSHKFAKVKKKNIQAVSMHGKNIKKREKTTGPNVSSKMKRHKQMDDMWMVSTHLASLEPRCLGFEQISKHFANLFCQPKTHYLIHF